ncbi:MAG: pyridoxamine 5'-phosphate oxidase family protein [Flexistipes sinusarabici]|uniref:Pyridoxamine 5'-phosphate oxidase family protein n=1 Tax=Flexistipes sinusarabici TaxID=2352 RepID=A0A5D0MLW7_FLESI|nr:pyridoxamine 5'-phosphate oxidase family protein [Flexistipes sinusarabici]TYB32248.1 MAG: pyridoxamine 5'-phosphate oxidase family protein [Flexistipes sinusarabici]
MKLEQYFEKGKGIGILATADGEGRVNTALYARPHIEDGNAVFVMRERRTYANLNENGSANYLYISDNEGFEGVRMYMTFLKDSVDPAVVDKYRRRNSPVEKMLDEEKLHLVTFKIDKILSLIGDHEIEF